MKRITLCVALIVLTGVCLDRHWYAAASVPFAACLIVAGPIRLPKRLSTRTTKPGVRSTREKAA